MNQAICRLLGHQWVYGHLSMRRRCDRCKKRQVKILGKWKAIP